MEVVEEEKSVIVIKDKKLGYHTAVWLTLGQLVQHMTLSTALGAMICASGAHEKILKVAKPLAISSIAMNIGHFFIWHRHPLNKYRVAQGQGIRSLCKDAEPPNTIIVRKVGPCFTAALNTFVSVIALTVVFWPDIKSLRVKGNLEEVLKPTENPEPK
ncbi:uncharacterized protein TNCT_614331 [Trichonephila clavata]|uniref:Uncharacterized protein n=1 Tax=Trichonephila clavata TaxID=2740835 RepID=A0A8X6KS63_TRICU|nr:uncharacterized protein TNCT_614331 [Trichonephila clavata]